MIGYVTVGTNDLPRAARFYDELLAGLDAKRLMENERLVVWAVRPDEPAFGVIKPYAGRPRRLATDA